MRHTLIRTLMLVAVVAALVAACGGSDDGDTITGTTWQWTGSTISEPATIPDPENYTIEFSTDGTFSAKVDCNQASGAFTTTDEGAITISPGPMTLAACPEGSLSDVYLAGLNGATSYTISDGQLVLTTAAGTMTFE